MMTLYDGAPKEEDSINNLTTTYFVRFGQRPSPGSVGDRVTFVEDSGGKWRNLVEEIETNDWVTIAFYPSSYVGTGSNFIEWKVYLSDMGTLNGKYVWIGIHTRDFGEAEKYPENDDGDTFVHIIDEDTATTTPTPTATPTLKPSPTPKATPTPTMGTSIIYGSVIDEEGSSFRNVTVSLTGTNGYSKSTKTDEDGYYEFKNLAAGDYTLTYEKDDYQTKTQEISLEEDEVVDLGIIVMEQVEKGCISGYVVDITGDPVESAKLKLKGISTGTSKIEITDADGFFEFTDLEADNYLITAKRKRYRSARKTVTIEEGEAKEIEIEMRKTSKRHALTSKQQTQDCRL